MRERLSHRFGGADRRFEQQRARVVAGLACDAEKIGLVRRDLGPTLTGALLLAAMVLGTGAEACTRFDEGRNHASVKDFGVQGDGSDADSARIQFAINSVKVGGPNEGKRLLFPGGGTYVCDGIDCSNLANVELIGYGATIKGPSNGRVKSYFNMEGAGPGVVFKGFQFDQMQDVLPIYTEADYIDQQYNVPIYCRSGSSGSAVVDGCRFFNAYTSGIQWRLAGDLTVRNCVFDFPPCNQTCNGTPAVQWYDGIHLQSVNANILIDNCRFNGATTTNPAIAPCGIFASGINGRLTITNCAFSYCGSDNTGTHRLGALDFYGDVQNVHVKDNLFRDCMAVAIRLNACRVGLIESNYFHVNANAELDGNTLEVTGLGHVFNSTEGTRDVVVCDNRFDDPQARAAAAVAVVAYYWDQPSRSVVVRSNTFRGSRNMARLIGPFDGVEIVKNRSLSGRGAIVVTPGARISTGAEPTSFYRRLTVEENEVRDTTSDNANGILVDLNTATKALVDRVSVVGNRVRCDQGSAAVAIVVNLNSSDKSRTRSEVRGNLVEGYAYAFDIKNHGNCDLLHNRAVTSSGFLLTSGMTNAPSSRGNFNNGLAVAETALPS